MSFAKTETQSQFSSLLNKKPIGKILVLDDEPDIVELITMILELENIVTKGIASSAEVDEALESFKPDVLFTDITMPQISGVQVLKKVTQTHPNMPVVFISGYVNKEFLMDAIKLGVFAVIEKPFETAIIVETGIKAIQKYKSLGMDPKSVNHELSQSTYKKISGV